MASTARGKTSRHELIMIEFYHLHSMTRWAVEVLKVSMEWDASGALKMVLRLCPMIGRQACF
jgi:hypothetical protein